MIMKTIKNARFYLLSLKYLAVILIIRFMRVTYKIVLNNKH